MPEKISVSASAVVADGGPNLNFSTVFELEAYNKLRIEVPNDPSVVVDADLGTGGATLRLLMIVPSRPNALLTMKVNGAGAARALDRPVLITSSGVFGIIGSITSLQFTNGSGQVVTVDILSARDLTPASD